MANVQEILDASIPAPVWAMRPTNASPLRSDIHEFTRADINDNGFTGQTLDARSGLFESRGADKARIYGADQGLLLETGQNTNLNSYSETGFAGSGSDITTSTSNDGVRKNGQSVEAEKTGSEAGEDYLFWGLGGEDGKQYTVTRWIKPVSGSGEIVISWGGAHSGSKTTGPLDLYTAEFSGKDIDGTNEYLKARKLYNGWVEVVVTTTLSGGTAILPQINLNNTGDIVRVVTQVEEGHYHSSYIPTTDGSATTRGADTLWIFDNGQPSYFPSEYTIIAEIVPLYYDHSDNIDFLYSRPTRRVMWQLEGGSWQIRDDSAHKYTAAHQHEQGVPTKIAASVSETEMGIAADGNVDSGDHDGTLLDISRLYINGGTTRPQTLLNSLSILPKALPFTPSDRGTNDPISIQTLTQ